MEKFIVCTYVLVGTDLTTKLIANKPCFSSKVIVETHVKLIRRPVLCAWWYSHPILDSRPSSLRVQRLHFQGIRSFHKKPGLAC